MLRGGTGWFCDQIRAPGSGSRGALQGAGREHQEAGLGNPSFLVTMSYGHGDKQGQNKQEEWAGQGLSSEAEWRNGSHSALRLLWFGPNKSDFRFELGAQAVTCSVLRFMQRDSTFKGPEAGRSGACRRIYTRSAGQDQSVLGPRGWTKSSAFYSQGPWRFPSTTGLTLVAQRGYRESRVRVERSAKRRASRQEGAAPGHRARAGGSAVSSPAQGRRHMVLRQG